MDKIFGQLTSAPLNQTGPVRLCLYGIGLCEGVIVALIKTNCNQRENVYIVWPGGGGGALRMYCVVGMCRG